MKCVVKMCGSESDPAFLAIMNVLLAWYIGCAMATDKVVNWLKNYFDVDNL